MKSWTYIPANWDNILQQAIFRHAPGKEEDGMNKGKDVRLTQMAKTAG